MSHDWTKTSMTELDEWTNDYDDGGHVGKPSSGINMKTIEEYYAEKADVSVTDAKAAVQKVRTAIKAKFPKKTDEEIETLVDTKVKQIIAESAGDKEQVIVLAFTQYEDENQPRRLANLKAAKTNLNKAIQENKVRLDEKNQPVAIDDKEFYDKEKTKKNPGFKKDLPEVLKRKAVFLRNGVVVRGAGKFDPQPYQKATGRGRFTDDYVNIYKKGWKNPEDVDAQTLWDNLSSADFKGLDIPLEQVFEKDNYATVATMGRVSKVTETSNGSVMVVLSEAGVPDVVAFMEPNEVMNGWIIDTIHAGLEVILFGQVSKYTDNEGKERQSVRGWGLVYNPASVEMAEAMAAVDDLDIDLDI